MKSMGGMGYRIVGRSVADDHRCHCRYSILRTDSLGIYYGARRLAEWAWGNDVAGKDAGRRRERYVKYYIQVHRINDMIMRIHQSAIIRWRDIRHLYSSGFIHK